MTLYRDCSMYYLTQHFTHDYGVIEKTFEENNFHFFPTVKKLEETPLPKKGKTIKLKKPADDEHDLNFLKEYIFYKFEPKIKRRIEKQKEKRSKELANAKKSGSIFECQCCFDDEAFLSEVVMCEGGCMFCRDCVKRGLGVQIGDNKTDLACLASCGQTFLPPTLESVLSKSTFQQLMARRQLEEIKEAGLADLVQCPACNFAVIISEPLDTVKVFKCGNPLCGRETCRLCKEESHTPLACDEVEKDEEVRQRINLENRMTEAMIRECPKCKKKFFKEEGCNKMKCECGQSMCYLCRAPIPGSYIHFYGQGTSPVKGKCPLWSENQNIHKHEIAKVVEEAKKEMDLKKLKHDPTKGVEKAPENFDRRRLAEPRDEDLSDDDEDFLDDDNEYGEFNDDDDDIEALGHVFWL